jgi:hypothetical protein
MKKQEEMKVIKQADKVAGWAEEDELKQAMVEARGEDGGQGSS